MSCALRTAIFGGAVVVGVGACSTARPAGLPTPLSACSVGSASLGARDTLSVGATDSIDATHAPVPTNAAERFAFAQVYETLIGVDCGRSARPALAASWALDATRTRITLVLRGGARFSTGGLVTAANVVASWTATAARSTRSSRLARQLAGATTIVDERTLIVSLPDTVWLVLADPGLAVYEPRSAGEWPSGTGPYRVVEGSASPPSGSLVLAPAASSSDPFLIVRRLTSSDPRDAIDAGVDVLVTGDPTATGYAAARPNLVAVPLPWTRTYALAVPPTAPRIAQLLLEADSQAVATRASLARDAVRAEARAAEPPYLSDAAPGCGLSPAFPTSPRDQRSNRIVYRRDDVVARGLAERLVALDARAVAAGLSPNDFVRALHDGGDLAYVLDLPYASLAPCDDLRELRLAAPWLSVGAGTDAPLVPLVDTRETAIVNRQRVSATADWDGTLRFAHPRSQP